MLKNYDEWIFYATFEMNLPYFQLIISSQFSMKSCIEKCVKMSKKCSINRSYLYCAKKKKKNPMEWNYRFYELLINAI